MWSYDLWAFIFDDDFHVWGGGVGWGNIYS